MAAWQLLEEQDESGNALRSYVCLGDSGYIDHMVSMRRYDEPSAGQYEDLWYHADDLFSTMAVSNSTGVVQERYEYDDYGSVMVLGADNDPANSPGETQIDNAFLFTGRYFDVETGLYYYRTRYLDPKMGRFTTRDIIGTWGDAGLGNGLAYVGSNPSRFVDPWGLHKEDNFYGLPNDVRNMPGFGDHLEDLKKGIDGGGLPGRQLSKPEMYEAVQDFLEKNDRKFSAAQKKRLMGWLKKGGVAAIGIGLLLVADDASAAIEKGSACRKFLDYINGARQTGICSSTTLKTRGEACKWQLFDIGNRSQAHNLGITLYFQLDDMILRAERECSAMRPKKKLPQHEGPGGGAEGSDQGDGGCGS